MGKRIAHRQLKRDDNVIDYVDKNGRTLKTIFPDGRIDYRGFANIHPLEFEKYRKRGPCIIYPTGGRSWSRKDIRDCKRCTNPKSYRKSIVGGNQTDKYFGKWDYGNKKIKKKT